MWQVQATITREFVEYNEDGSTIFFSQTRQIPTFFLDENVQGILTPEGALKIALEIIDPFDMFDVSGIAVKL